ncbi:N-6 DNA methylase [Clostridium sp. P21]|uniref:site-specific DNA-methyltransferase (adenine-specific) n=1 Tax=Clostridium muellerianum TaxID=2716538 RepID=A0A7Y0HQ78_9CLOT|nr:N-6 DNA methylase [Clostridium muellerianum]NMM65819.1 N-6 DNA methylase [Clostridium muellerianum]
MESKLNYIINLLAKDIKGKLPKEFEARYYEKMSFSKENIVVELKKDLLHETISFEIAFIHVILFVIIKILNCKEQNYLLFLIKLDKDKFFSWYKPEEKFLKKYLEKLEIDNSLDVYSLINQHDKLINKDIKKKLGQFYTPVDIVKRIIMEMKSSLKNLQMGDSVIDPACGTGVFLIETLKMLKSKFHIVELIHYVNENVYGFDVNPFAILATKINLMYEMCVQAGSKLENVVEFILQSNTVFRNVQWKNTIIENDSNKYTIILGNPPYFKLNKKSIKEISDYDDILYGQPNIYSFFMHWGIEHLSKDGIMCFIVPQSIRSGLYFKKLRAKMSSLRIKSIIHIDSRQNIFDRAEQAVLIICLENKPVANTKTKIQFYDGNGSINAEFKISRSKLMMNQSYNNIFIINRKVEMYDILDKVYANSLSMDSDNRNLKFSNGLFVWNQHKEDIVDYEEQAVPIIYGGNVQPLEFNFNQCSSNKERKQFAKINDKTKTFALSGRRLLVQRTTNFEKDIRLKACIIPDSFLEIYKTYFLENHVNFLCHNDGKSYLLEKEVLYYYLGMLNSKLVNYIFISKSGNTQVSANELNSLPFPITDISEIAQFVRKYMKNLKEYQKELDLLVCRSYMLSENETDFIIKY